MAINPYTSMLFKVDWLSLVIEPSNDLDEHKKPFKLLRYLGYNLSDFDRTSSGRFFLNSGLNLGNYLMVYYDDVSKDVSKNSSHLVVYVFTGQGSTDLAKKLNKKYKTDDWQLAWIKFFKHLKRIKARVTRIDAAVDDFYCALDMFKIEKKIRAKEMRSSRRRFNIIKQLDSAGDVKGFTIYIGQSRGKVSKNGNYYCRFYDKRAQYISKNAVLPKEVENLDSGGGTNHWVRAEIAFQKAKAQNFVNEVLNTGSFGIVYRAVMRDIVEFLVKPRKGNINKSRWKVCDWWEKFLDGVEKNNLSDPERDLDLGRLLHWIRVSVVGSIKLLEILGKEKNFNVYNLISQCDDIEFSKKQERLLNNARAMSKEEIAFYLKQFKQGYKKDD